MISTEFALALARVAGHACAHVDALGGDFFEVPDDARIEQRMQTLGGKAIGHYPDWLPSKAEIRASFLASYCAELGDSLASYRFEQSEDPDNETIAEIVDDLQKALTAAHVELVAAEELADRELAEAKITTSEERAAKRAEELAEELAEDALAIEEDEREFAELAEEREIHARANTELEQEYRNVARLRHELAQYASSAALDWQDLTLQIHEASGSGDREKTRELLERRERASEIKQASLARLGAQLVAAQDSIAVWHKAIVTRIKATRDAERAL
jgi:hypothetical protein